MAEGEDVAVQDRSHGDTTCTMPLIVVNGYPGVGKSSIAVALGGLIARSKFFDNHLLIDPVAALLEREDPGYADLRKALRAPVLNVIAHNPALRDRTIITTHYQQVKRKGRPVDSHEFLESALKGGRPFISVILQCQEDENVRRLLFRPASLKTKLTDPEILLDLRRKHVLYSFNDDENMMPIAGELRLDIDRLSAEEAACSILDFLKKATEVPLAEDGE